jgi:hypothetical protein
MGDTKGGHYWDQEKLSDEKIGDRNSRDNVPLKYTDSKIYIIYKNGTNGSKQDTQREKLYLKYCRHR